MYTELHLTEGALAQGTTHHVLANLLDAHRVVCRRIVALALTANAAPRLVRLHPGLQRSITTSVHGRRTHVHHTPSLPHDESLRVYVRVCERESNQTNDVAKRENRTKIPENICSVNYGSQPSVNTGPVLRFTTLLFSSAFSLSLSSDQIKAMMRAATAQMLCARLPVVQHLRN